MMCLRSSKKVIYGLLGFIAVFISIGALIAIVGNDDSVLFAFGIASVVGFPPWWIAFGREIQLTEEGCIVKFLCFRKLYRWSEMKTKKRKNIKIGRGGYVDEIYNGLLFSCRKMRVPGAKLSLDLSYRVPTLHPFSLVFVLFEPNLVPRIQWPDWVPKWLKIGEGQERGMHTGYFADEEQLLSLLHSWGVTLDDE